MIQRARVRTAPLHRRSARAGSALAAAFVVATSLLHGASGDGAAAQGGDGPTMIDQTGGGVWAVVVEGDRAYYAAGPRLVVADLSDPARPRELGRSASVDEQLHVMAVRGTTAIVTDAKGIWRFDISDAAAPRVLGHHGTRGEPRLVAGRRLYATDANEIVIYDLPDSGPPIEVGVFRAAHEVPDVAAGPDGVLWFTDDEDGELLAVDARDPAAPRIVGRIAIARLHASRPIAVDGRTAYVVTLDGLQAVDIADPAMPRLLAHVPSVNGRRDFTALAAAGGRLVAGYRDADLATTMVLEAFDAAQPGTLPLLGTWKIAGDHNPRAVAWTGDRAVLATWQGLRVVDFAAAGGPSLVGSLSWQQHVEVVQAVGTRLVSADNVSGLWTYGVDGAGRILPEAHLTLPDYVDDMLVVDDMAFVAVSNGEGLHTVSLADPAAPRVVGRLPGYTTGPLATLGTTVFATAYSQGGRVQVVRAIDVADPAKPRLVAGTTVDMPGTVHRMRIAGQWLYVANDSTGLWILDVADPAAVSVAGRAPDLQWTVDVAVDGHLAYVADAGGLRILDVADPATIRPVGLLPMPGGATSVHVDGTVAYVVERLTPATGAPDFDHHLVAVDVRDPAHPVEIARATGFPTVASVRPSPDGRHLVVAAGLSGLYTVDWPLSPAAVVRTPLYLPFVLGR